MIDDLTDSVMVLLNAIYFNGLWRRPFPLNETVVQPFYTTSNSHINTTFMSQTEHFFFLDWKQLDAKILRLPYKVHFKLVLRMIVFVKYIFLFIGS